MILDQPRSRRRLGRLLWPALITAAAIFAVVVSGAGRDTRAELEYLDTIQDQAEQLSLGGDALRDVISRLSRIDRVELVTVVDGIREDLSEGLALVEEGAPSESLVAANALYRQALQAWSSGVGGFASGVLAAADDPESTVVVDNVANALVTLRSGDDLYRSLVEELSRSDVREPVAPMRDVTMMPADGELVSLASAYIEAARSENNTLALRPGLALSQIVSNPRWDVNPSDQVVVPFTESVSLSAVVTNTGNVASAIEGIQLAVSGGPEPIELSEEVAPLRPGEQTTIMFESMPVEAGGVYEATASLVVLGDDITFEDNELTVVFTVNES